jgi:biopolymer transport protein ExbD
MRKKREIHEVNASSMADIAFLLLTFFLMTASMGTDRGLARQLPPPIPPDQKEEIIDINRRNILMVLINSNNDLMVNDKMMDIRHLRSKAKEFIANRNDDPHMPEKTMEDVPFFGEVYTMSKHVISLQNDRGTEYQAYISVQNELMAAYRELRDELARNKFGISFADLDDDRKRAVQRIYPLNISEAEPRNYGGTN